MAGWRVKGAKAMSQEDLTKIRINSQSIGVIGLKHVMEEMAEEYAERADPEVRAELMKRVSRKNYIPDRAKEDYGKVLLREFKKFLGKPYQEDAPEGLDVKILGPGCTQCNSLEREVMEVVAEMNLAAGIEHVTDIKEIGRYGVMGTPALIINGKVMSVGKVPTKAKIKDWLSGFA
jgi:small redox-active disulfide protein 2